MLWCRRHQSICRRQFDIDYNKYSAASTMKVPPACRRPRSTSHMASSNGKSSQQTASSTGWQHWIRIWNLYRQRIIHDLDCLLQLLTMRETVYWNVHWLLLCRDIGAKKTVGFVIGVFLNVPLAANAWDVCSADNLSVGLVILTQICHICRDVTIHQCITIYRYTTPTIRIARLKIVSWYELPHIL